jgi:hypothetical protein
MKLMATRFGEDDEDIENLPEECGIHDAQKALEVLKAIYPAREPPAKTRFFLEELLGGSERVGKWPRRPPPRHGHGLAAPDDSHELLSDAGEHRGRYAGGLGNGRSFRGSAVSQLSPPRALQTSH